MAQKLSPRKKTLRTIALALLIVVMASFLFFFLQNAATAALESGKGGQYLDSIVMDGQMKKIELRVREPAELENGYFLELESASGCKNGVPGKLRLVLIDSKGAQIASSETWFGEFELLAPPNLKKTISVLTINNWFREDLPDVPCEPHGELDEIESIALTLA